MSPHPFKIGDFIGNREENIVDQLNQYLLKIKQDNVFQRVYILKLDEDFIGNYLSNLKLTLSTLQYYLSKLKLTLSTLLPFKLKVNPFNSITFQT
jgi:hypothetical protein